MGADAPNAWRGYRQSAFPEASWTVGDGALRAVSGAERVDLVSRRTYRNFELKTEWRVARGGNSGVLYRVTESAEKAWQTGPEMQLLDDERHPDGEEPTTTCGALYALMAPRPTSLRPAGEWNTARVVVRGTEVQHWLNGDLVLAADLADEEVQRRIAESKFADYPRFAREPEGHVALQHHGDDVWFRDITVRPTD